MKQVDDTVGEEFEWMAGYAELVQLPKHRLTLIVLAEVFLQASAAVEPSLVKLDSQLRALFERVSRILPR